MTNDTNDAGTTKKPLETEVVDVTPLTSGSTSWGPGVGGITKQAVISAMARTGNPNAKSELLVPSKKVSEALMGGKGKLGLVISKDTLDMLEELGSPEVNESLVRVNRGAAVMSLTTAIQMLPKVQAEFEDALGEEKIAWANTLNALTKIILEHSKHAEKLDVNNTGGTSVVPQILIQQNIGK